MISKGDLLSISPPYVRFAPNSNISAVDTDLTVTFCMSILENENIDSSAYDKENVKMTSCIDAKIKDLQTHLAETSANKIGKLAVLKYNQNISNAEVIIYNNVNKSSNNANWNLMQFEFGVYLF